MKYITEGLKRILPLLYYRNKGINVLDEEWDNLIILDDCRYDIFKELYNKDKLKGKLEYRISKGSNTQQWLITNFTKIYDDILYITANPQVNINCIDKFPKLISVWKKGWNKPKKDKKYINSVLAKTTYKYAIKSIKKIKHKRTIIHFIQPHSPYPNGTGEIEFKEQLNMMLDGKPIKIKYKLAEGVYCSKWPYITTKTLQVNKLQEEYKQNLASVLQYVEKLAKELKGKTIISADHGEAFGEKLIPFLPFKVYSHPGYTRIPILIKVPWFIVKK